MLAEIGEALSSQPVRVRVRIPRAIAEKAAMAWERDDWGPTLSEESPEQVLVRERATALALIGLAVREVGVVDGDHVVVEVDAQCIATALDPADEANGR